MKTYMAERRRRRRVKATEYLGGKCVQCGSTIDLQFDHIDPNTKDFEISKAKALDGPWERLEEELKKCQLLCELHHIDKTRSENKQRIPWNKGLFGELKHGTAAMYEAEACRCESCREAKRLYRRKELKYQEVLSG